MNLYTIGETARILGVNAPTLRYYDKEGLLPFVGRSSGGIRLFKESDFDWLRIIECLKSTGMPIKDIKQFIDWYIEGDPTFEKRRDMFYERKSIVEEQIKQMQNTLDIIKYKCWFYDTAVQKGTLDGIEENMPDEIKRLKEEMEK